MGSGVPVLLLLHGQWELDMASGAKEDPQHDLLHHQIALAPPLPALSLALHLASHLSVLINHLGTNKTRENIVLIGPWSDTDWKQVPFKSCQTQENSLRNVSECIFCFQVYFSFYSTTLLVFLKICFWNCEHFLWDRWFKILELHKPGRTDLLNLLSICISLFMKNLVIVTAPHTHSWVWDCSSFLYYSGTQNTHLKPRTAKAERCCLCPWLITNI